MKKLMTEVGFLLLDFWGPSNSVVLPHTTPNIPLLIRITLNSK